MLQPDRSGGARLQSTLPAFLAASPLDPDCSDRDNRRVDFMLKL